MIRPFFVCLRISAESLYTGMPPVIFRVRHCLRKIRLHQTKKAASYSFITIQPFSVEVTGLEPATAWSQTRNATNCATPRSLTRFSFYGCKGNNYS